ncbi:VOC family protein [Paenibacillus thermotolerans]|uniref:VOC family protein n=1 Tax=Paenibacillus thermotolerans TaxID=3027807 RepID=UPI002368A47C|nr:MULTISPECIES: VOC family protein [unclassified Paenibacillus]
MNQGAKKIVDERNLDGYRPSNVPNAFKVIYGIQNSIKQEEISVSQTKVEIFESIDHIQIVIHEDVIADAAAWYINNLGFTEEWSHEGSLFMLNLPQGHKMMIHSGSSTNSLLYQPEAVNDGANPMPPFIFKTSQDLKNLKETLESQGATTIWESDEGFADYLSFKDPFGQVWSVMKSK